MAAVNRQRFDFGGDPKTLIELGTTGRVRVTAVASDLRALLEQIEGTAGQLAVQEALGLSAEKWLALTAPEGGGVLTCFAVPPDTDAHLREWVRMREA